MTVVMVMGLVDSVVFCKAILRRFVLFEFVVN